MSMHILPPKFTTTGKKPGRSKFRSSAQAQRSRQAQSEWQDLLKRHGADQDNQRRSRAMTAKTYTPPPLDYRGRNDPRPQSLETTWAPCTKSESPVYTGDKIIGIGTLHKSNAVPIFTDQEAKDIARMRR